MDKKSDIYWDIIKEIRCLRREEEIKAHGKPIRIGHIQKNPKAYSRKAKHKVKYDL